MRVIYSVTRLPTAHPFPPDSSLASFMKANAEVDIQKNSPSQAIIYICSFTLYCPLGLQARRCWLSPWYATHNIPLPGVDGKGHNSRRRRQVNVKSCWRLSDAGVCLTVSSLTSTRVSAQGCRPVPALTPRTPANLSNIWFFVRPSLSLSLPVILMFCSIVFQFPFLRRKENQHLFILLRS